MSGKLTVFKVCDRCGKEFVVNNIDHARCLACRVDGLDEPRLFDDDDYLTIRDEFAMLAMNALLTINHISDAASVAGQSYVMADAMLKARKS